MNANALREKRIGILVHYSAGSHASTVAWCRDPRSGVSYNAAIAPNGHVELIVPYDMRAWHAGICRPSSALLHYADANSAFEGIALSGGPPIPPTPEQVSALVKLIRDRFAAHGWPLTDGWRVTGHDAEAWPRGRKQDPTGADPAKPWLDLHHIREAIAK